jgi:pyruvate-formate lyase
MCYKVQYPALMSEIAEGDMYAGRCTEKRIAYVGSFKWFGMPACTPNHTVFGKQGGFCFDFSAFGTVPQTVEEKEILRELDAFWRKESNVAKIHAHSELKESVGFSFANNLDKLVKKGFPGLTDEVNTMAESPFKTGLLIVLETMVDVCRFFQKQAEEKGNETIAKNLSHLIERAPETIAEAMQLILIFERLTRERHYEIDRFDVALGDLYVRETDGGAITEEQAIKQIQAFYEMINENGDVTVCRLVMGGKNRRNVINADRFIETALKAEQRHKRVTPQVTLRLYEGLNPKLIKLAYETINETYTFPTLYNDDAIIDGVAEIFGVSAEEAVDYYPLGCGEFIIGQKSPAVFCSSWDVVKTVDAALRAGNAETFDDLYQAVITQIKSKAADLVKYHRLLIDINKTESAFLTACLLMDDCLQNGKPVLEGGARYVGACVMGHGFTNAADALTAIKKWVYKENKYSLAEIIKALDDNFTGCENQRKDLLDAPKYGNDDHDADAMASNLWRDINTEAKKAGKACDLDFLTISSVNPGGYQMGLTMGATADGRRKGEPYAICNAPTAGFDKNGLTALMNSILKTHPANGGSITNFKVSREFFTESRDKFEALFGAYFAGGGLQANIAIINKGDLEAALNEPEKYSHVLVRLGGWTARFIDLERHIQEEILRRTLY